MDRRKFFKLGVFSIPAIYLFPETFRQLAKKNIANNHQLKLEPETEEFMFKGRCYGEMKNNHVILPKSFRRRLIKTKIHFLALKGNGYVNLIPCAVSLERSIRKDLQKLRIVMPGAQHLYLAHEKMGVKGQLLIPKKMTKFAGIHDGQMVIVGMLGLIEIWGKDMWDNEYEKLRIKLKGQISY